MWYHRVEILNSQNLRGQGCNSFEYDTGTERSEKELVL